MIIKSDDSELDLIFEDGTFKLYYGKGYAKPGTLAYSLKDSGDEYIFQDHFTGQKTLIDYSQFHALSIFLSILPK